VCILYTVHSAHGFPQEENRCGATGEITASQGYSYIYNTYNSLPNPSLAQLILYNMTSCRTYVEVYAVVEFLKKYYATGSA
jgi:hypothetical protein